MYDWPLELLSAKRTGNMGKPITHQALAQPGQMPDQMLCVADCCIADPSNQLDYGSESANLRNAILDTLQYRYLNLDIL